MTVVQPTRMRIGIGNREIGFMYRLRILVKSSKGGLAEAAATETTGAVTGANANEGRYRKSQNQCGISPEDAERLEEAEELEYAEGLDDAHNLLTIGR